MSTDTSVAQFVQTLLSSAAPTIIIVIPPTAATPVAAPAPMPVPVPVAAAAVTADIAQPPAAAAASKWLCVNQEFDSKDELKRLIRKHQLHNALEVTQNNTKRYAVKCKEANCSFSISAHRPKGGKLHIASINIVHTCKRAGRFKRWQVVELLRADGVDLSAPFSQLFKEFKERHSKLYPPRAKTFQRALAEVGGVVEARESSDESDDDDPIV